MPTATLPLLPVDLAACCSPVTAGVLDDDTAEQLARVFKALGDPTRVRLLSLIAASTGGEACACDLIEPVNLSQPTVSHHMRQLVDAGLVTREQRGKWAYYRLVNDTLQAVATALTPTPPEIMIATAADRTSEPRPRCGCCGQPREHLVELRATPGVFICRRCARWAMRQADRTPRRAEPDAVPEGSVIDRQALHDEMNAAYASFHQILE